MQKPVKPEELQKMIDAAPDRPTAFAKKERKLLVFTLCKGFKHSSVPYGATAMGVIGRKTGAFEVTVSDDPAVFARDSLEGFDAVCFDNTTGTLLKDPELRASFMDFVRSGKGVVGIHAATDCFYDWAEFSEMMGGYFSGHPWNEMVGVKIDDREHPLNAAFGGRGFEVADEIYQFRAPYSRDALRVLTSIDIGRTNMKKGGINRGDSDFAVSWCRSWGEGRVFYCSLGHRHDTFWNAPLLRHYLDGIQFAFGDLEADTTPVPLSLRSIDPYMGIYEGTYAEGGRERDAEARVIAEGGSRYRVVAWSGDVKVDLAGGSGAGGTERVDVRLTDSPNAKRGVKFEYYEGVWSNLPNFDELTPKKTGKTGYFEIGKRDTNDNFAFRFKGFMKVEQKGVYSFTTNSDDGSALHIGGKKIVDNDGLHGEVDATGKIELEKGMHPITVTFFEQGGGEALKVGCSKPAPIQDDEPEEQEGIALRGTGDSADWTGRLTGDGLEASAPGRGEFKLAFVERKSPTEGKAPPPGATVLLPLAPGEKPSLDAWRNKNWIAMADGSMQVKGGDQRTVDGIGSSRLHIEFRIPFMPTARGQGRGNSGVYVQDRYEVQVLDSFGLD
ncbi:MAG: ThuA domain-containing protein, partial [Planctomycetota bacterium]